MDVIPYWCLTQLNHVNKRGTGYGIDPALDWTGVTAVLH